MEFVIRPAVTADAEGITAVHFRAWREAYTGLLPDDVFDTREADPDDRIRTWREIIDGRSPFGDSRVLVAEAEAEGRIVGWATAGDGRDDDAPYPNELNGLYVYSEAYGTGAGRALLEAAVGTKEGAYVWALDGNARAIAFYRKMGFEPDGAVKQFEGFGVSVPELRLVRNPNGER